MTQFDLYKADYEHRMKQGEMTAEEAAPKIRVMEFMASCTKDDLYEIADSTALNDVIKGYTAKACKAAGLSEAQVENILDSLDSVLGSMSAKEVVE